MGGSKFAQQVALIGDSSTNVAAVDSDGNVQTDVNNPIAIDDTTPIDVAVTNTVTTSEADGDANLVYSVNVTATGNTQLIDPAADKKVRLLRFHVSQSGTDTEPTVGFRFGAAGTIRYTQKLPKASPVRGVGYGRTTKIEGAVDDILYFNSDTASVDLDVTIEYKELS